MFPKKDEIRKRAIELYYTYEQAEGVYHKPEDEELKECGFWHKAQIELMRKAVKQTHLKITEDKQYIEYVKADLEEFDKKLRELESEVKTVAPKYTPRSWAEEQLCQLLDIPAVVKERYLSTSSPLF